MKKILFTHSICLLLFTCPVIAQKKFLATRITEQTGIQLNKSFTHHLLFSINTAGIAAFFKAQKGGNVDFELLLPGFENWKFSVSEHDILSNDYTLVVNGMNGKTVFPKPACMTYTGYLSDISDSKVRLTIDNDIIYGIIKKGDKEYYIEPLRYFKKEAAGDLFVVYEREDVVPDATLTCGVTETAQKGSLLGKMNAGVNCVQTQLAIASDESMFLRYGSALAVQTHNIGVMNNVMWDYVNAQFTDNIEFVIVTQNVSTSAATDQLSPAYTGTDPNVILPDFRTWGEAGNFGATYDIAQFWTTRDFDGSTVGLAYVGTVCTSSRYHILQDFPGTNPSGSGYELRVLASHEIGHNFNCVHDAANSGFIMQPSVGNTSTWSAVSVSTVNDFVSNSGFCLSDCELTGVPVADFIALPEAICTGGTMQLVDHSLYGPTAWSWTMTGGSPATSAVRNPAVSYAASGAKTISLTSSNIAGAGTQFSKSILVSDPAATACSNTGTVTSDAGIKSFTLNNINKITGGTATDGNKYMDFSCSDITSLQANTTYTVSVEVGTTIPSNQFNLVQLFIDYNNDGDFLDANEAVHSSPSCYIGTYTFSFTTINNPPVTNQLLRARVIAKDCVGGSNSCYNVTNGQVEDYAVYFLSTASLPISLLDFTGQKESSTVRLNWQTASEFNNEYFDIETSKNGNSFYSAGKVNSKGNASFTQGYAFIDRLPVKGKNYYRLKQVDIDGQFTYSKTITVDFDKTGLPFLVYPNPVKDKLIIDFAVPAANITLQIFTTEGQLVRKETIASAQRRATLNTAGISGGIYILQVNTGGGAHILKLLKE